jgi:DNA topoisomerase-1
VRFARSARFRRAGTSFAWVAWVPTRKPRDVIAALVELGGDPLKSAAAAGLTYVTSTEGGIRRAKAGRGFRYVEPSGARITDADVIRRIRALAIPPAWTAVRICPRPNGHIQATGRDARGRKQYRYHPRWRLVRDETKFGRMLAFAAALPSIRQRVAVDLGLTGLPRSKVLAAVTLLLERTLIRVGNEEYARQNDSFGLTTLHDEHVDVVGTQIRFHFRGKSGKNHVVDLRDRRLALILRRCQDLPGQELFHYLDEEGEIRGIESADVNDYLREAAAGDFTAKDFRTWYGTLLAAQALGELATSGAPTQKNVAAAIVAVASRLGNTPSVCRKSYVHPAVITRYLSGNARPLAQAGARKESEVTAGLRAEEDALLTILREELTAATGVATCPSPVRRRKAA